MLAMALLLAAGMSYLFYDTLAYTPLTGIYTGIVAVGVLSNMEHKNRMQVAMEFLALLEQMSAALYAGVSFENSYVRAVRALQEQYGSDARLCGVLENGIVQLGMNVPLVQVFTYLAEQTALEDIVLFSGVAAIAHKNGGNLMQVIAQASGHIREKQRTDQEIAAMISAKKMEQSIMCGMPLAMLVYMKLSNPGYFSVLYHTVSGALFMSACLAVMLIAYLLGRHCVDIQI